MQTDTTLKALRHNDATSTAVIGHFPYYQAVAKTMGANCFSVSPCEINDLSAAELWHRNRTFLMENIEAGTQFLLTTAPEAAKPGSWFERELAFLIKQGANLLPAPMLPVCGSLP